MFSKHGKKSIQTILFYRFMGNSSAASCNFSYCLSDTVPEII